MKTDTIREQTLAYALWRSNQVETLDVFKEELKKDMRAVHQKNMEAIQHSLEH